MFATAEVEVQVLLSDRPMEIGTGSTAAGEPTVAVATPVAPVGVGVTAEPPMEAVPGVVPLAEVIRVLLI